jgi:hypothetical protein
MSADEPCFMIGNGVVTGGFAYGAAQAHVFIDLALVYGPDRSRYRQQSLERCK